MTVSLLITGLKLVLVLAFPLVVMVTLAGVLVAFAQAATGIQDSASSQAARLVVAGGTLLLSAPWILRTLAGFTRSLWGNLGRFVS